MQLSLFDIYIVWQPDMQKAALAVMTFNTDKTGFHDHCQQICSHDRL